MQHSGHNSLHTKTWNMLSLLVIIVSASLAMTLLGCSSESTTATDMTDTSTQERQPNAKTNQPAANEKSEGSNDASAKATGLTDIWFPTKIHYFDGREENQQSIADYEAIYETNCFIQLKDDKSAGVSLPYQSFITTWKSDDDLTGELYFLTSNEVDENGQAEAVPMELTLSEDRNNLTIAIDSDVVPDATFTIQCERNQDRSHNRNEDIVAYEQHNDSLYENMNLDTDLPDVTLYNDDTITLTLLGTTSNSDNDTSSKSLGFWIAAENKTDEYLLATPEVSPHFSVHGIDTVAVYPRVIPPHATKHIFLSFDAAEINNDLSDVHGTMSFLNYGGDVVVSARIDI